MNFISSAKNNYNIFEQTSPDGESGRKTVTVFDKHSFNKSTHSLGPSPRPFVCLKQPFVAPEGFVSLFASQDIRVDITANCTIRVSTPRLSCSVDPSGQNLGIIHPLGLIFKDKRQNNCHIESGVYLTKMATNGIAFTSLRRPFVYMIDASGCKPTSERFHALNYDFVAQIFNNNCYNMEENQQMAVQAVDGHKFETEGDDNFWYMCGTRIRHNAINEELMMAKCSSKIVIHVRPSKDQFKITTPRFRVLTNHCKSKCLQVIKSDAQGEQRVTRGKDCFEVTHGSQKASFDLYDQLVL